MSKKIVHIKRALISVSDKTNIEKLANVLINQDVQILSTGGTARLLKKNNISVTDVSDYTGFPEILDGRVKTLVPKIHGGILGRRDVPKHQEQMKAHDIEAIDLVVVNLYPFEETVGRGADKDECIENIDIGGPALIRASAKNFNDVAIVTDPQDYDELIKSIEEHGGTSIAFREKLARKAFARTAAYDSAIARWFDSQDDILFPKIMTLAGTQKQTLRYGENPHQKAAFYRDGTHTVGVASAQQLHGKALSYNNINDTDAAFEAVTSFEKPAIVIVKHANPCGIAVDDDIVKAWDKALACDPLSAYGGIVACNVDVNGALAQKLSSLFLEVVIAPNFTKDAVDILSKKKNLRLLKTNTLPHKKNDELCVRSVRGGFLVQTRDNGHLNAKDFKVVTKRQPTEQEMRDLVFAFRVVQYVHSNAIIFAKNGATMAIGAGQMSRVDSARIAVSKSQELTSDIKYPLKNSVAASDAFFPFADGLDEIVNAGATAVIQPGGSIRDDEVIAAADKAGISMVFTSMRHFLH